MKFERHIVGGLLLSVSFQAQTLWAVEFNAAQGAAIAIESELTKDKLIENAVEVINANDPSIKVIDAMEVAPAPAYQPIDAEDQLNQYLATKGLHSGWIEEKKMYISTGVAFFDSEDPSYDDSFITKRSMKSMEAKLNAKADIIEFINTTMSALDKVEVTGTDIYAKFNERQIKNQKKLAAQQRAVTVLLADVDAKQADELRGVTFSDRAKAYMDAAIKKLDETYSVEKIEEKKRVKFQKAKERYLAAKKEQEVLEKEISAFQGQTRGKSSSQIATLSSMPLFGAVTVNQFESWDADSEQYKVALLVMWSKSTEKMARAMITGEKIVIPPGPVTLQTWLNNQNWATMTGSRRFRDERGDGWFIGVDARPIGSSSSSERQARGLAEMSAKKEVAMSLFADMESKKRAETVMIDRTDAQGQDASQALGSYAASLRSSIQNRSISGLQKLYAKKVTHPISGQKIYIAVYGMSSSTARKALAMQGSNYVTQLLDIKSQQKLKGTKAGLKAAVHAAEQEQSAYRAAKQNAKQQVQTEAARMTVNSTTSRQTHKSAAPQSKGSQSGVYGGGADSFDW